MEKNFNIQTILPTIIIFLELYLYIKQNPFAGTLLVEMSQRIVSVEETRAHTLR